jgi:hypothetical protein
MERLIHEIIIIVWIATISFSVQAQKAYKYSDIPEDLIRGANAVVRNNEVAFEVKSISKAVMKVKSVITILNTNAIKKSEFNQLYGKFEAIHNVNWELYDKDGNTLKNRTNIKLEDYSAISGYSLFEDHRVKHVDPKYRVTPFTIEYTYEVSFNGLLSYPDWQVYDDYNVSVEKTSFSVTIPDGMEFRYLEKNVQSKCMVTKTKGGNMYSWEAGKMSAIRKESFGKPLLSFTPVVYTAPFTFEIDNYKGSCETWSQFSEWIARLGEGRDVLEKSSEEKVSAEISGLKSDREKVEALYRYMQKKVRYVSLQVGIGGWQTIDAATVDRLSYGDCKALTNFMRALLKVAGIKSFYTLAYAGEDVPGIIEEFPSNQFNHVLLMVPLSSDTLWLECTNQHIPPGYIGTFTDDRAVLPTGEGGGRLIRTRAYSIEDNLLDRKASVAIDVDGNASSTINSSYNGIFYDENYRIFLLDNTDRKQFIQSKIPINNFTVTDFRYSEKRSAVPCIVEDVSLSVPGYCSNTGPRMLFNPNLITRFGSLPERTSARRSDILIKRPYIQSDTITIDLPVNYNVDNIPKNQEVKSGFGEYETMITVKGHEITYIRKFKLFKGEYPASRYDEFVDFCENVTIMDERKISIRKN